MIVLNYLDLTYKQANTISRFVLYIFLEVTDASDLYYCSHCCLGAPNTS